MVVGRRSDCAVDTALRAAGVGIVGLAYDDWAADEHLEREERKTKRQETVTEGRVKQKYFYFIWLIDALYSLYQSIWEETSLSEKNA